MIAVPRHVLAQVNVVTDVKKELGYTSNLSKEQLLNLVTTVAKRTNLGILRKSSGNNCGGFSCDYVCNTQGQGWDILSDSEGSAGPTWDGPKPINGSLCVMQGPDAPNPQPPSPSDGAMAATKDLQQQQIVLLLQIVQQLQQQNVDLKTAIQELRNEIAKGVKIRF